MYVTAVLVDEQIGVVQSTLESAVKIDPEKQNESLMKRLGKGIFKKVGTQDFKKDIKEFEFKPIYG